MYSFSTATSTKYMKQLSIRGLMFAGQQTVSEPLEEVVARELPPWMRAETSMSVSRSAESTGAAQFPGQQGVQQASSTKQQSLQVRGSEHDLPRIETL